jgi:DNA-binding NarL/FixJ family response regulator
VIHVCARDRLTSEALVSALQLRGVPAQVSEPRTTSTPQTLLMDAGIGEAEIREHVRAVRAHNPLVRVLAWTVPGRPPTLRETPTIVLHDVDDLVHALKSDSWEQAGAARPAAGPSLTPRESAIVRLIAQGEDTNQIAARLGISQSTVRKHVGNLLEKLGTSTRFAAVARARQLGVLTQLGRQHTASP